VSARLIGFADAGRHSDWGIGKTDRNYQRALVGDPVGPGADAEGNPWLQLYGIAFVSGIGVTISLFIGSLAFPARTFDAPVRLEMRTGPIVSAFAAISIALRDTPTPAR
jgi:hypothetical protein